MGAQDIILGADKVGIGAIAQLGERRVRNAKVAGSIPAGSIYISRAASGILGAAKLCARWGVSGAL